MARQFLLTEVGDLDLTGATYSYVEGAPFVQQTVRVVLNTAAGAYWLDPGGLKVGVRYQDLFDDDLTLAALATQITSRLREVPEVSIASPLDADYDPSTGDVSISGDIYWAGAEQPSTVFQIMNFQRFFVQDRD